MTTRIIGTGSALPKEIVTNDDLAKIVDTNDEWISSRTGIRERHLAKEETCSSLAAAAGKMAMEDAGVGPEEIDLIVVATCSPDSNFPSTACKVQELLGLYHAAAFDVSAACSGFLVALHTVYAYMNSGLSKTALIIGAETLSKLIDWTDRGTCVLFGDGAGAVVAKADDTGIIQFVQGADGSMGQCLTCDERSIVNPFNQEAKPTDYISMDGQAVFKFAVTKVPECIRQVLEESHTDIEEIKYFVLHQANSRILSSVAKRLKMPVEKFPMNLDRCGNTSAASIPILLDEMNRQGMLKKNDKIVMSGFGAGLTWGATLLEW